jgi:putative oxidoreductase
MNNMTTNREAIMATNVADGQGSAARTMVPGRTFGSALRRLVKTDDRVAPALLRVALGLIMFPHGAQHALGWFGGYGFARTHQWMTETLGFPAALVTLAIGVELLAPVALVLGIGGRIAALGIVGLMVGAASTHLGNGFFMNWFGGLPAGAEGFEYHLLVLAIGLAIAIEGSGAGSIDRALARRRER